MWAALLHTQRRTDLAYDFVQFAPHVTPLPSHITAVALPAIFNILRVRSSNMFFNGSR